MINLLPSEQKLRLKEQENWKRVFVVLTFILVSLLFLAFLFQVSSWYIVSKVDLSKVLADEAKLKSAEFKSFEKTVSQTNQNLSKIQKFWQTEVLITPLFEKLIKLTPETIYFTNFSFKKHPESKPLLIEVNISGFAKTREDLFNFKESLEKEKSFENLYFLPSSWVAPTNAKFSLFFKYEPR
jgi:Tfp pilus assembly protein PilN